MNSNQSEITGYILDAFHLMEDRERVEVLRAVEGVYCLRCGREHPKYLQMTTRCQCNGIQTPIPAPPCDPTSDRSGGGCTIAGPGRGDCIHFIGLPDKLDETTTDEYGKPHGWCWSCWKSHKIQQMEREIEILTSPKHGEGLLGVGDC